MTQKIKGLPDKTLKAIKIAACIGIETELIDYLKDCLRNLIF